MHACRGEKIEQGQRVGLKCWPVWIGGQCSRVASARQTTSSAVKRCLASRHSHARMLLGNRRIVTWSEEETLLAPRPKIRQGRRSPSLEHSWSGAHASVFDGARDNTSAGYFAANRSVLLATCPRTRPLDVQHGEPCAMSHRGRYIPGRVPGKRDPSAQKEATPSTFFFFPPSTRSCGRVQLARRELASIQHKKIHGIVCAQKAQRRVGRVTAPAVSHSHKEKRTAAMTLTSA